MIGIVIFILLSILIAQIVRLKYCYSKFLSIILLCFLSFLLSHFLNFSTSFLLVLLIFCSLALYFILKKKIIFEWKYELLFIVFFAYFLFLRSLDPDLQFAEKPMDIAFLNSVLKAEKFPPNDPFFAGGSLNFYYYFGYVIGAGITMMSFEKPEVGINIALAAIAAFSFFNLYCFLKEKMKASNPLLVTVFVLAGGNLYAVLEFVNTISRLNMPGYLFYWNATRVIKGTINEFPYFSFIHADYHAHVVAIPIKILALTFAYDYYVKKSKLSFAILSFLTFVLYLTNSWDFPVFALITFILFLLKIKRNSLKFELPILVLLVLAVYTYINLVSMNIKAIKIVKVQEKTNLLEFIEFWAFQLFLVYLYMIDKTQGKLIMLSFVLGLPMFLIVPIGVLLTPLILLSIKYIKRDFNMILVLIGTLLMLVPEFVGVESRLNTVFKYYLISWIFLSIPAGIKLSEMLKSKKKYMKTLAILLLILCMIYPIIATPVRHYKAELSLNGMDFVRKISIGDYEGIKWLKNKRGNIVEASVDCYQYGGRFAAFTGNPTLIGWACHEVQWRQNVNEIVKRIIALNEIYESYNCEKILSNIKKYKIKYVIVGFEERRKYNVNESIFDKCGLKLVFDKYGTKIYEYTQLE